MVRLQRGTLSMSSKVDAGVVSCRTGQGETSVVVKLSCSVEDTIVLHIHKEGKVTSKVM